MTSIKKNQLGIYSAGSLEELISSGQKFYYLDVVIIDNCSYVNYNRTGENPSIKDWQKYINVRLNLFYQELKELIDELGDECVSIYECHRRINLFIRNEMDVIEGFSPKE